MRYRNRKDGPDEQVKAQPAKRPCQQTYEFDCEEITIRNGKEERGFLETADGPIPYPFKYPRVKEKQGQREKKAQIPVEFAEAYL